MTSSKGNLKLTKLRQRQFDFTLERVHSVLEPQLLTLNDHKIRLLELRQSQDYPGLHTEQLRTSRCIKQLTAIIKELDNLQVGVNEIEVEYLNEKIEPLKIRISREISDFVDDGRLLATEEFFHDDNSAQPGQESLQDGNIDLQAEVAEKRGILGSWQNLKRDLTDLNATLNKLASLVWTQRETTDSIDSNITHAQEQVHQGAIQLTTITKGAALPLLGAAAGAACFGPIGFVVGYKIAALACIGTGFVGYQTGKVVQKFSNPPGLDMIEDSKLQEPSRDASDSDERATDNNCTTRGDKRNDAVQTAR